MLIRAHLTRSDRAALRTEERPTAIKNFLAKGKPIIITKLAVIVIMLACLQVSAEGYSQLITLKERNASLQQVLKKIKSQSGYDFFYNLKSVEMIGRITVDVKNASVGEALDACFRNTPLTYSISGKIIVISKRDENVKKSYASLTNDGEENPYAVIRGRIENEKAEPLEGATISLKGKTQSVSTDKNGAFQINAEDNDILVISFIGYKEKEIAVNGQRTINIRLDPEADNMQGVVVVAYGTQKKESLTSSISQIKGTELTKRPVSNVQQSLQGLAPGVTVLDLGGPPGRSEASIRVRGVTTFNINGPSSTYGGYDLSKNDALVIIDGIEQRLSDFNPDDIETISVLKDASSTAIYGSRATNGVILVTTKRAKGNKVAINYHGYYGIQKSINSPKMMDLEAYMRMQVAAYTNSGVA
ncbi:MAG TPA: TonB-dependent receptor plug domain-containing protein, partial [Flavitalea sp.]|nr:TonB-dependent receptor plug domain-containing protein [Flavitalea sp.]